MIKKIGLFAVMAFQCFASVAQNQSNAFALSVFSEMEKGEENLAFAPYGLYQNIGLLSFGAKKGTKKELRHALGLSINDKSCGDLFANHYPLQISTALFAHEGTQYGPAFIQIAERTFGAKLHTVNFHRPTEAITTVNQWIAENTQGKIGEMLEESDIDQATRLILTNAIFFEKGWLHPFLPYNTHQDPFYTENGEEILVEMMRQSKEFAYFDDGDVQGIYLPFAQNGREKGNVECLLLLPSEKSSLAELEAKLSETTLAHWKQSREKTAVQLLLPKFSFSKKLSFNETLKNLGVETAFTKGANFQALSGDQKLYLQNLLQESFVAFHEKGVTAAAATSSQMGMTSIPPQIQPDVEFVADRPFLFLLLSAEDDTIFFMGRVAKPSEAAQHKRPLPPI